MLQLNQLHKEKKIDFVHSLWLGETAAIGYYFSKKNQISHLTTLMGKDAVLGGFYSKFLPLQRMKLITLSKFHQNKLYEKHKVKSEIIPWGVANNVQKSNNKKVIDVIGVGSLISIKRFDVFVEVIASLKQIHPNIVVEIIGEGIKRKAISAKIKELKLEKNIVLVGAVERAIVLEKMATSKILLHTSEYESFGFVFAEAIQSQLRIVSFPVGVSEESNFWKICDNKEELIKACHELLIEGEAYKCPVDFNVNQTIASYKQHYINDKI